MEELLPHHVLDHILERLAARTLLKFKSASKQWKATIQSPYFQKRNMIHRRREPDVLLVVVENNPSLLPADPGLEALRRLVVGSGTASSSSSVSVSLTWEDELYNVCDTSCDGLICLYNFYGSPSVAVNPTTGWHRPFPESKHSLGIRHRSSSIHTGFDFRIKEAITKI